MKGKSIVVYITFFLLLNSVFSQHPSFSVIGATQFQNTDIYGIVQDNNDQIWICGNTGLWKFNGVDYQQYATKQGANVSLFGITTAPNGTIWCHNLKGEIFTVVGDSLQSYFTIPKELLGSKLKIDFDSNNQLIIGANAAFLVKEDKSIQIISEPKLETNRNISLAVSSNGKVYSTSNENHNKLFCFDKKLNPESWSVYYAARNHEVQTFGNEVYLIESNTARFYRIKNKQKELIQLQLTDTSIVTNALYITNNHYVLRLPTGGILLFNKDGSVACNQEKIFQDYFISGFMEDANGNYWLTTFNEGILFMPNARVVDFKQDDFWEDKTINLIAKTSNEWIAGTKSGELINLFDPNKSGKIAQGFQVEYLEFEPKMEQILTNGKGLNIINEDNLKLNQMVKVGSVKDHHAINPLIQFYATNHGIYLINKGNNNHPIFGLPFDFDSPYLTKHRSNAVLYDTLKNELWVGSINGLHKYAENDTFELLHEGKKIHPKDLTLIDNSLWISTSNSVFQYESEKGIMYSYKNNTRSLLKYYDGNLWFSDENGISKLNPKTKSIYTYGVESGLIKGGIKDFELNNDTLALVINKTVQFIPLSALSTSLSPTVNFTSIYQDSILIEKQSTTFKYDENHLIFNVASPVYGITDNYQYYYRLKGLNEKWEYSTFTANRFEYKSLTPGKYQFEVKLVDSNNHESNTLVYSFSISPPFWQQWWFLLFVAFGIAGTVAFAYKLRINQILKKNKEEQLKQRLEKELVESQLTALRSQMNPHFIFNSLNSIQDLILQQDTDKSYDYIVEFADLVRSTLKYSGKEFIAIEEELKFLNTYLSLEKLRFKEHFSYEITTNINEGVELPSLVVQPFIENALLHGLLHKEGEKKLTITYEVVEILTITITDNGIGRTKAKEIKERQGNFNESFSMKAIQQRLEILSTQFGSKINYEVVDLHNNGVDLGTSVILKLPIKQLL